MKKILLIFMVMATAFTTYAQGPWSESNASNNFENGYNVNPAFNFNAAADLTVPAGMDLTLNTIAINLFMSPGATATDIDVTIYENDGLSNLPGAVVDVQNNLTPASSVVQGNNFGFDISTVTINLTPIVLAGDAVSTTTYWVGVQAVNSTGGHTYWEISSASTVGYDFAFDNGGGWSNVVPGSDLVYTFTGETTAIAGPAAQDCHLDCPGDMVVYLDAGECCWPAQYEARTEGTCNTNYDTILGAPPVVNGFVGDFDISTFSEWDPTASALGAAQASPFTLNGPGSVAIGAGLGVSGAFSAIDMNNLPNEVTLYARDRFEIGQCDPKGEGAVWNYTMVNFVANFDGTLQFDWDYVQNDAFGLPVYDPFGYLVNGSFTTHYIASPFGASNQNGTFNVHMSAGQAITFFVRTDDADCSSHATMNNFSFVGDPITDGIVVAEGPAIGTAICKGETGHVKLYLLNAAQVIDSCEFDLTVVPYQNPKSSLTCNDQVQISVDQDCNATVGADDILEGGPYGCYDDYRVEIYDYMPAAPFNVPGNIGNPVPLGNYFVGIFDAAGNNCWSQITVLDKMPPTIECVCPEGGEFPAGAVVPGSIGGAFTSQDLTANLHFDCWDFGTGNQIPDLGDHYYDLYAITVSGTGTYAITGSDGNKMIVGVFDAPFNAVNSCSNMIDGMGGYVLGSSGLFFEEPTNAGNIDNTVDLVGGTTYYVVVSDFDAGYFGDHSLSITPPQGEEVYFAKTVYGAECEFAGCYEEGVNYAFPLPTFDDNCSANLTWVQTVTDGPDCGTYIVKRVYTATDGAGMTATCTSDYFFKGIDLSNMEWPVNFDGVAGHNDMLECNTGYVVDANGNPHPIVTGAPAGFNDACGTIEVFYEDQTYPLVCGTKILREWTVVDDCTGGVYQHIQVIRITDTTAPTFMAPEDLRFKTKAYVCNTDIEVPTIMHLADNCDAYPRWYVTTNAGVLVGDNNGNGYVDAWETWSVVGVPMGTYEICYHAIDNCGNTAQLCADMVVFDGNPPNAACEQYKQVSLTAMGNAKVWAADFDSGSFDNCNPVHFKVLRTDSEGNYDGRCGDWNGDDKLSTPRYKDANGNWKNNEVWFDDDVFFCCPDRDLDQVMVTLRVFDVDPGNGPVDPRRYNPGKDLYGHYNDCWTLVTVECKIPPALTCPDLLVTCEESLDPFVNDRIMPQAISVCGLDTIYYSDKRDMGVCGAKITRTWTAYGCGMPTQCKQKITVEATEEFDPCTIKFPRDVKADCAKELRDGGEPTWDENPCNVVTAEVINEDTFTFVDGACYKIVREWAVIDWCVYESNTGAEDNVDAISGTKLNCAQLVRDGYYRYTQILMVTDFIPPTITVEDQCVATSDCYAYDVEMEASATDSCNVEQKFNWKYIVTNMDTWETVQYSYNYTPRPEQGRKGKKSKDDLDRTQVGKLLILDPLPIGNYRVTWTVGDGCGNANSVNQYFEVADKKAPTPIMVDIATAVMQNGMVELKARTFDKGGCDNGCISSLDNCTPKDGLYFTFTDHIPHLWENPLKWAKQYAKYGRYFFDPTSGAISTENAYFNGTAHAWLPGLRTSQKAFICSSYDETGVVTTTIKVYVWDKFDDATDKCDDNNFDYANVVLSLKSCGDLTNPLVSGMVSMRNSTEGISGMTMTATSGNETKTVMTSEGAYSVELEDGTHQIEGAKDANWLNGVTTLDIVLIQKHLLGIKAITDPYSLIAADANNDGSLSASDLLQIRKLILGSAQRFDNNSWVAIAPDYTRTIDVEVSGSDVSDIDFTAVKIADVNGSANTLEERSASQVNIMLDDASMTAGDLVEVPFYAKDFNNVYGAQFTMNLNGLTVENIVSGGLNVDASNINVLNNNLVMSWNNAQGVSLTDGDVLFTLTMKANTNARLSESLRVTDNVIRSEAYTGSNLEVKSIKIGYRNADTSYALYQNEPNPFAESTVIGFDLPKASNYTLSVYDVTGKNVMVINERGESGYNAVTLSKKDLRVSGVLYYKLESGDYTATKKMVIIK